MYIRNCNSHDLMSSILKLSSTVLIYTAQNSFRYSWSSHCHSCPSFQRPPKSSSSHPCSLQIPQILRHVSIGELLPDSLLMSCEDVEAVICINRKHFFVSYPGGSTYLIDSPYSWFSLSAASFILSFSFSSAFILGLSTSMGTLAGGKSEIELLLFPKHVLLSTEEYNIWFSFLYPIHRYLINIYETLYVMAVGPWRCGKLPTASDPTRSTALL